MTRFARASGSKGANEKQPEEASTWQELKASLLESKAPIESKALDIEADIPTTEEIQAVWADLVSDSKLPGLSQNKSKTKKIKSKVDDASSKQKRTKNANQDDLKENKRAKKLKLAKVDQNESNKKSKIRQTSSPSKVVKEHVTDELPLNKKRKKAAANVPTTENINQTKGKKAKKRKFDESVTVADDNETITKIKKIREDVRSSNDVTKSNNAKNNASKKKTTNKVENQFAGQKTGNEVVGGPPSATYVREKKRRKEELKSSKVMINGKEVKVAPFDGFMVQADDASRLQKLRTDMKKRGIPHAEIQAALKMERRRAEKSLAKLRKQVCFHCRGSGHNLSECPEIQDGRQASGICYKCGSTEHTHFQCKVNRQTDFPFAECFVCKEQGHIARQCPDNPRGLYPRGGGCSLCLDVTHLKKDCPKYLAQKTEQLVTAGRRNDRSLEALDEDQVGDKIPTSSGKKVNKHIRF